MGCDYYIIKQLRIIHSQGTSTIELDRERCYFNVFKDIDSDDSDLEEKMNKQYDSYLEVTYKPRILYDVFEPKQDEIKTVLDLEPRWKNNEIEKKYFEQVNRLLTNISDNIILYQVIKEEVRYLR